MNKASFMYYSSSSYGKKSRKVLKSLLRIINNKSGFLIRKHLLIILVAFLISIAIFTSNLFVSLSTICLTMIFKVIIKNSSKVKGLSENILVNKVLVSIQKTFNKNFKKIIKSKDKELKTINFNIEENILANILSYLASDKIQSIGFRQLVYLLKNKMSSKASNQKIGISLKIFVQSSAYKTLLTRSIKTIKQVVLGSNNTILLTDEGKVYICGAVIGWQILVKDSQYQDTLEEMPLEDIDKRGNKIKQNIDGKVIKVAHRSNHIALLTDKGNVYVCGYNFCGELGIGHNDYSNILVKVKTTDNDSTIVDVATGCNHTAILTNKGNVYVCGLNNYGQLGLGDNIDRNIMVKMPLKNINEKVKSIVLGNDNTAVLTDKGNVYVCGVNSFGQLGLGNNTYTNRLEKIQFNKKVVQVALGHSHTVLQTDTGKVYACGYNYLGQLGLGDTINRNILEEVSLENVEGSLVSIAAGYYNTSVQTNKGKVYISGWNNFKLAFCTLNDRTRLKEIPQGSDQGYVAGKIDGNIVSFSNGEYNSAILTDKEKVYIYGENNYGQLGLAHTKEKLMLVEMPTIISRARDALNHAYKVNSFIRKIAARKIIKKLKEVVLKRRLAVDNQLNNPLKAQVTARELRSWVGKYKDKRDLNQVTIVSQDQEGSLDKKAVTKRGYT